MNDVYWSSDYHYLHQQIPKKLMGKSNKQGIAPKSPVDHRQS